MSWRFCTKTGGLYLHERPIAVGYSGHAEGRNNPKLESHPRLGPIPSGRWLIQGPPFESATHGPCVLRLEPHETTLTFGRTGFLIHGDRAHGPAGEASLGCIILPLAVRQQVWASGVRDLIVSAEPPGPPAFA